MNHVARLQDVNDSAMSDRWAAPERFQTENPIKPSDIWSFGCLVYEVMLFICVVFL
jgi:serine/threonine protein kinase